MISECWSKETCWFQFSIIFKSKIRLSWYWLSNTAGCSPLIWSETVCGNRTFLFNSILMWDEKKSIHELFQMAIILTSKIILTWYCLSNTVRVYPVQLVCGNSKFPYNSILNSYKDSSYMTSLKAFTLKSKIRQSWHWQSYTVRVHTIDLKWN